MTKSINQKFKKNIIVLSIIITIVFLVINVSLYIINNNYLVNKVSEENSAFLQITTHIINENEISVALEYVEHYTHIHEVDIEVFDENENMLFSTNLSHLFSSQYQISTLKGTFVIYIDNTNSITVNSIEKTTIYVNLSLLFIYIFALGVLLRYNRLNSKEIDQDISNVLKLIDSETINESEFNHTEFQTIHNIITKYLENIDLLTEQKSMNMKGLAHDIKTPLTVIYSYFERILKSQKLNVKEAKTSFEAAIRINELLNDIIEDNKRQSNKEINISEILKEKIEEYTPIFSNKDIIIKQTIINNLKFEWRKKDFVRVIDNLISNAYYYSKKSSVLEINVKEVDGIQIEFISKPINIVDIDKDKVFKKGVRGSLSYIENSYGKGYGLYLCRLLLGSIGGSLNIEILNENVKFTIIL
ncbi:HAMP domain-containing sensor histidine kinase [Mycoplasmatota bacterium WC30]